MQILQEITEWEIPNGIYHVNDQSKLIAFQPVGGELITYTNPLAFTKSYRKFKVLKTVKESIPGAITINGSNGKVYTIVNGKCNCPGATFRGKCKHVG